MAGDSGRPSRLRASDDRYGNAGSLSVKELGVIARPSGRRGRRSAWRASRGADTRSSPLLRAICAIVGRDDSRAAQQVELRVEIRRGVEEAELPVQVVREVHLQDLRQWPGGEEEVGELAERQRRGRGELRRPFEPCGSRWS